jgi:repressor LexA
MKIMACFTHALCSIEPGSIELMLTERQDAMLDYLRQFQADHGVPPSTRDIQKHFQFGTQTTVIRHLRVLAARGKVEQCINGSWGLRAAEVQAHLFNVPVFGTIPAGLPAANEQAADEALHLDPSVFGLQHSARIFGLRVRGDSMIGAHIVDGDVVLLQRRPPEPGDIVAALVDGETTLKRLVTDGDRSVLRAENPRYPDILPADQLEIQGVVVGVIGRGKR